VGGAGPGPVLTVGLAGFGAIGQRVAAALDGPLPGLRLGAITSRDLDRARERAEALLKVPPPVVPLAEMALMVDVVVEAAPAHAFPEIATAALRAGRTLVVLSAGALLEAYDAYVSLAQQGGGRIHVISGAIGGLDALAAAAVGDVESVTLVSRKPPRALAGAPYLEAHGLNVLELEGPQVVFEGTAREACRGFPANVNIAAAISLAGIGPDRTRVRIVADPTVSRNTHELQVVGSFGRFTLHIENVPTENPRTGMLAAQSAVATLRKLASPVRVGT
jgi:aspartate dehydrogenase